MNAPRMILEDADSMHLLTMEDYLFYKCDRFFLTGAIDTASTEAAKQALMCKKAESDGRMDIFLNSEGGDVHAGLSLYDCLYDSEDIKIVVSGMAASMAAILLLAVPLERRMAYEHSRILFHNPFMGGGSMAGKRVEDLQLTVRQLSELEEQLLQIVVSRTAMSRERAEALMKEDRFLSAQEAKELGVIDRILKAGESI